MDTQKLEEQIQKQITRLEKASDTDPASMNDIADVIVKLTRSLANLREGQWRKVKPEEME